MCVLHRNGFFLTRPRRYTLSHLCIAVPTYWSNLMCHLNQSISARPRQRGTCIVFLHTPKVQPEANLVSWFHRRCGLLSLPVCRLVDRFSLHYNPIKQRCHDEAFCLLPTGIMEKIIF